MSKTKLRTLLTALAAVLGVVAPATALADVSATPNTQGSTVCQTAPYQPPAASVTPFTTLPFRAHQARGSLVATQGWVVSPDEEPFVDGPGEHRAIDFEFHQPGKGFGLPIVLPNNACVYQSYQAFDCDNLVDGKHPGCGAGLFTEAIFDNGWVMQVAHYDWVNPKIPFLETVQDGEHGWHPAGVVSKSSTELKKLGVRMHAGEVLGLMGESGITFGYYDNFRVVDGRGVYTPRTPTQRAAQPNWEAGYAQAHVAYHAGRANGGARQRNTDPFGWYGQITPSNDQYNGACAGRFKVKLGDTLYRTRHGNPLYATR